jgi:hypothetical protein
MKAFRRRDFGSQIQQSKRKHLAHFHYIIANFHFDSLRQRKSSNTCHRASGGGL